MIYYKGFGLSYFYKDDCIRIIKYLKLLYENTNYTDFSVCERIVICYEGLADDAKANLIQKSRISFKYLD